MNLAFWERSPFFGAGDRSVTGNSHFPGKIDCEFTQGSQIEPSNPSKSSAMTTITKRDQQRDGSHPAGSLQCRPVFHRGSHRLPGGERRCGASQFRGFPSDQNQAEDRTQPQQARLSRADSGACGGEVQARERAEREGRQSVARTLSKALPPFQVTPSFPGNPALLGISASVSRGPVFSLRPCGA